MPKALLLENIHPDAAQSLRDHGFEVECLRGALNEDELIDALEDVDLLGIRSKTSVTSKVIDARPTLTAVGCFCIGTNQSISTMRASTASPCSMPHIPTLAPWWNWLSATSFA